MVNSSLAALTIVSAISYTSAFVQIIGPTTASQRTVPLHATESFQRSLLAERLGTTTTADSIIPPPDAVEAINRQNEKFQRSLLKAKFAYDAIDAALALEVKEQPAARAVEEVAEVAMVSEPEPTVPEPEPVSVAATAPVAITPEPEISKPIVPEPVTSTKQEVKSTTTSSEFSVPREFAIVPINEATVQFTAGTLGAVAGLALGGPILAAFSASIFNYLSRQDKDPKSDNENSPKQIVDKISLTALTWYNSLAQFEKNNKIVDTTLNLAEKVGDKAKETPARDVLVTIESTLGGMADSAIKVNDDYDLIGGAETVLDSVGDFVEASVDKVVEMNDEYRISDRVGGVVKGVVGKGDN